MAIKFKSDLRIFVYSEYIDLRAGFDKLTMIVRDKLGRKLVDGDLFLFLGSDRRKCKAICYDGTGVVLISKRIERGRFMRLEDLEEKEITADELDWLLRGSIVRRAKFGEIPIDKTLSIYNITQHDNDLTRTRTECRTDTGTRSSFPG